MLQTKLRPEVQVCIDQDVTANIPDRPVATEGRDEGTLSSADAQ